MTVEVVNPLALPQWDTWVGRIPKARFFHGSAWCRVLHDTYGHRPVYPCWRNGDGMKGMLPLMEVSSPVTGRRGVSLPFTDYCKALGGGEPMARGLFDRAMTEGYSRRWRYLECRSAGEGWRDASPSLSFWGHSIDLTVGAIGLFEGMESAVRRGVRKAEKAGLKVEFGTDARFMTAYFELHCRTRRRHGLPPQPLVFFQKIQELMLTNGGGTVGLAWRNGKPIAGAVYLCFGRQAFYKYGASDEAAQEWRPNNLLMWLAMEHFAGQGFEELHLGRTSLFHEGLRRFKRGFGAIEERLSFCKFDFAKNTFVEDVDKVEGWFNRVFAALPLTALRLAGRMLYPHLS